MTTAVPALARLDLMTVERYMHAGVVSCDAEAPLATVASILAQERIHCVVVSGILTTSNGARLTWGSLTDRDLLRTLDSGDTSLPAGRIAATEVVTVEPYESIQRVVQLMNEHEVSHLVVVERGFPVGVISSLDVARAAADR